MKSFLILAVLSLIPGVGFTQGAALESEVDSELEQLYTTQAPAKKVVVQAQPAGGSQTQPIYILNQATPSAQANAQNTNTVQTQQIQKQPTTFVEASPMVESRADQMRKSRMDAEGQTETKIVEKLEQSRLDDEKRRADVLFGNKFDQLNNKPEEQQQQPVQPVQPIQPTVIQVPVQTIAPPPVEQKDVLTREAIREELQSALKVEQDVPATAVETKYFSALLGMPDHPDSSNIRGNYSLGAIFGTKYDDTYAVEGAFVFSNYTMNPIYYNGYVAPDMDVNQYSGSIGIKYFMFSGMVKPFVGGLGQYTYRTFQWANTGYAQYYTNSSSETSTNSHAIDLGVNVGADVTFNSKFTVGFDYRYFFNLSSRRNQSAFAYQPYYGTALEQLNSTLVSVTAKVQF
ncbi:MAG: hypothetical protein JNM24_05910 [Bdellovibrionaceae bacterium]|nr:hypothetical protein [Pseudobdellovibrionaceae bacterium]